MHVKTQRGKIKKGKQLCQNHHLFILADVYPRLCEHAAHFQIEKLLVELIKYKSKYNKKYIHTNTQAHTHTQAQANVFHAIYFDNKTVFNACAYMYVYRYAS